jgi:Flp pilus assembly protein TadD
MPLADLAAVWPARLAEATSLAELELLRARLRAELAQSPLDADEAAPIGARMLEQLADVCEELGDRKSATLSWKAAARMHAPDARRLYERVLDAQPDDRDAAEQLVRIYAESGDWDRVPEVVGVVIRDDEGRGGELVLQLEAVAWKTGMLDALVAMIDEAAALQMPSAPLVHRLRCAKARALAANPRHRAEASRNYRAILEAFEREDDAPEYAAFIESQPDSPDQHAERRWLCQWRVTHATGATAKIEALRAWAKIEEAHGDREQTVDVHRQLLEVVPDDERAALGLKLVDLLEADGRAHEALVTLAAVLVIAPPVKAAHEIVRMMLADARSGAGHAAHLEAIANDADDAAAARLFEVLVTAREETIAMPDARRRWWRRALDLSSCSSTLSLSTLLQGARDLRDEMLLWDMVERTGRAEGELGAVVHAYADVIATGSLDARLAETLGRRMVDNELEGAASPVLVTALERVLAFVPSARWALERVRLGLGAQGRWAELFRLHDRAIEAASGTKERVELLGEAAFCARDLADDPERAIGYLASAHALEPESAAVSTALERLYERQDKKSDLVLLLEERAVALQGPARRELERRIAALWLDLGMADEAAAALDTVLDHGGSVGDVSELFERVARQGHRRAIQRLAAHYESVGRVDDVVRMLKSVIALADSASERAAVVREIVRLRLATARSAQHGVFAHLAACIERDAAGDPGLAKAAYRAQLVHAISAWKKAPTDAAFDDAAHGAWHAIEALGAIFLRANDARTAARLFERGAHLRFERTRRRALLHEAALLWSDRLGAAPQAIRVLSELFEEDSNDASAIALFDRFRALLEAGGHGARLARLWEDRGRSHAAEGNEAEARACWERAGALWEGQESAERATVAYDLAAATGSEAAFEALARIHVAHARWHEAAVAREWLCTHARAEVRGRRALDLAETHVELGRSERARATLETALEKDEAGDALHDVRARLIDLYRGDGMWRPLATMLEIEGAARGDVAMLCEAADVRHAELDEPAEAARLLELAAATDAHDLAVRPKLVRVLEGLERWEAVAAALTEQCGLVGTRPSKESALLFQELAHVLLRLGRASDALEKLATAAKMLPTDPALQRDLGRVALAAGDLDVAERAYRALLLTLRNAGESCEGVSRLQVYLDLSGIALRKSDLDRAINLLDSALETAFEHGEDSAPVERALRDLGRFDLVARALEGRVARTLDVAARAGALHELAATWREHLACEPELGARLRSYADAIARDVEETIEGMELGASRARLRLTLANILADHRVDAAIAHLSSAVDENPFDAEAADLLSSMLEREGRFDEQATLLASRICEPSQEMDAAWQLGQALERAGRRDDAARLYASLLDGQPTDREIVRTLVSRLEALGSDRLADGLELLVRLDPSAACDVAERLADLRDAQGDVTGLVRALELGLGALPEDRALVLRLASAHRATGAEAKNLRLLDAALASRPADAELLVSRASTKESLGDDDGAVSDLRDADAIAREACRADLAIDILSRIVQRRASSAADAHALFLADVLVGAERTADAERELEAVLTRAPDHAGALERLSSLAVARKDWARAADAYGRLVLVAEPRADLALAFARACEHVGRAGDAREALERALKASSDNAELARRLEQVCEMTADKERLAELLVARAERTSTSSDKAALLLRAATLFLWDVGSASGALALVERARSVGAEGAAGIDVALRCAKLYLALGRPRDAITALAEVIGRSRGKRSPLLATAHLDLAKAHLAVDELVEAFEALKAGFSIDVRNPELAMLLGLVAIDLGELKAAERALLAVATFTPKDDEGWAGTEATTADKPAALYHLATLAHAKGDLLNARRWASKALAEDATHDGARGLLDRVEHEDVRPVRTSGFCVKGDVRLAGVG